MINIDNLTVSGTHINYYYICKRKLWLFVKGITMEDTSCRVLEGKLLHESCFLREKSKEVLIDNLIRIDIINDDKIKEIKFSDRMKEADLMQIYYYLWYLEQKGVNKVGEINYVKQRRREQIKLTDSIRLEIKSAIKEIEIIKHKKNPLPIIKLKICTKCAYFNFCFVGE